MAKKYFGMMARPPNVVGPGKTFYPLSTGLLLTHFISEKSAITLVSTATTTFLVSSLKPKQLPHTRLQHL